jgi:hypothetical protein
MKKSTLMCPPRNSAKARPPKHRITIRNSLISTAPSSGLLKKYRPETSMTVTAHRIPSAAIATALAATAAA